MIHPLNRCELTTLFKLEQCSAIEDALRAHQIEYQVKSIDRSSPSIFNMGSRERSGTMFQDMSQNWRYVIYVKRADLAAAQDCTSLRPMR